MSESSQCIVVIQARTGSSRLPAKVLLPVAGMPLVVLAARRAANTGRRVIVATSSEPDDDELVKILVKYEVPFFRGNLHNTLARVVSAVEKIEDDTIFVRLTADNSFPDGALIDEVVVDFQRRSSKYLCCGGVYSGLPYGVSLEVTRIKYLREAALTTKCPNDQEHVTPFIKRKYGVDYFETYNLLKKAHYRCSVDQYEDYLNICNIFSRVSDPVFVSCLDLIQLLEKGFYQPISRLPVPKLVIGTAQIGLKYGIANQTGRPSLSKTKLMLRTAIANGVEYFDTARAYGASEQVISKSLSGGWKARVKVITKLSPDMKIPKNADPRSVQAWVDASIFESCMQLGQKSLDVLMLHRAYQLTEFDGKIWDRLLELQRESVIDVLGVSIQSPEELSLALGNESVGFIQMPFNLIDWRWSELENGLIQAKINRDLLVHVRSAFLQGLLLRLDSDLWQRAHCSAPLKIFSWLQETVQINGCDDIADLCLRYARSQSWVDGVVVGMETQEQMVKNILYFNKPLLGASKLEEIESSRPIVDAQTLDPSLWIR